jgi:hypothetical protein
MFQPAGRHILREYWYILWAGSTKCVSRCKHQIKEQCALCYIAVVVEDFDAVDITFLSLFVCVRWCYIFIWLRIKNVLPRCDVIPRVIQLLVAVVTGLWHQNRGCHSDGMLTSYPAWHVWRCPWLPGCNFEIQRTVLLRSSLSNY